MPPPSSPARKRATSAAPQTPPPPKKSRKSATATTAAPESPYVPPTPRTEQAIADSVQKAEEQGEKEGTVLLHPELKFKYEDAKQHLIATDKRWKGVMDVLPCKPFEGEQNDPFNPFK
jgi:DNA-3-methyladenine glycosylase II